MSSPLLVPAGMLHPPGMIGIPSGEQARWTEFTRSLITLERPARSTVAFVYGAYIQAGRDQLVREMLASPAQWLFMVDDDHTFDRRLLINLLDRHVDVVGALAVSRKPPYFPCAHSATDTVTGVSRALSLRGMRFELQEVAAVGTGAILIRREVLEAMGPPWFESAHDERGVNVGEDVLFCEKARAAGFRVWLDATQQLGHLTGVVLKLDERGVVFELDHEQSIVIPMEQVEEVLPDEEEPEEAVAATEPVHEPRVMVHLAPGAARPSDPVEEVDGQLPQPRAEGNSLPGPCLRVLTAPHDVPCGSGFGVCPGLQRDGTCLAEAVRAANAAGEEWEFEIDSAGYWTRVAAGVRPQ